MGKGGRSNKYGSLEEFGACPISLDFHLESYLGPMREINGLRRRQGWLMMAEVTLDTYVSAHSKIIFACCDEYGAPISQWLGSKLFEMRCSLPRESYFDPPEELPDIADALYWDFLGTCDLQNLKLLEELEVDTNSRIVQFEARHADLSGSANETIRALQRQKRLPDCEPQACVEILEKLDRIEIKLAKYESWVMEQIKAIRENAYQSEKDVFDSLTLEGSIEPLSIIHWRTRGKRRGMEIKLPPKQQERPNHGIDGNSPVSKMGETAMRQAQFKIRERIAKLEKLPEPETTLKPRVKKPDPSPTTQLKEHSAISSDDNLDQQLASALSAALLGFAGS